MFGTLKAQFDCYSRGMDINLNDLMYIIHSCFILHNFCKIRKEPINTPVVTTPLKYDLRGIIVKIKNNGGNSKKIRNIYVSYLT